MEEGLKASGILNILKPPGMTSFDVIAFLRGALKIKKIGHTGTLDPDVAGVLPVCIGKATKAIEHIIDDDKTYRAELTLGISTDTQDTTGNVISTSEVSVSHEQIVNVFREFTGTIMQTPPMFSAVKVGGKKLYQLARNGITIERPAREAKIYSLDIIRISNDKILFDVSCSKGTYIRTLCSDIGDRLGCGGAMSFLIRLKSGMFEIADSITLQEVNMAIDTGGLSDIIIPVDEVLKGYSREVLADETEEKRLLNGAPARLSGSGAKAGEIVRVYGANDRFLALGKVQAGNRGLVVRAIKQFI